MFLVLLLARTATVAQTTVPDARALDDGITHALKQANIPGCSKQTEWERLF